MLNESTKEIIEEHFVAVDGAGFALSGHTDRVVKIDGNEVERRSNKPGGAVKVTKSQKVKLCQKDAKIINGVVTDISQAEKLERLGSESDALRAQAEAEAKTLPDYAEARRELYALRGLGEREWLRAFLQKEVDGDPSEWDALIAKRNQVKIEIPKG